MTSLKIYPNGTENWYDERGARHRDNGLPALVMADGCEVYYVHGYAHRENGPAFVKYENNQKIEEYWLHGKQVI